MTLQRIAPAMLLLSMVLGFAPGVARSQDLLASVLYRIDVNSDPKTEGEVSDLTTLPGLLLSIEHPNGKGGAHALATYGLLRASARLDPDFATDQRSTVQARADFSDLLTITGANLGDVGRLTLRLRVTGSIQQPFYVSEVTGYASASASLSASSDLEPVNDDAFYSATGPEPILVPIQEVLTVSLNFTIGQTIWIYGSIDADAEAQDLTVDPGVSNFMADFENEVQLLDLVISGVVAPVVTSASGTTYGISTVSVPSPHLATRIALAPPSPNPFRDSAQLRLSLPREEAVSVRVVDTSGRMVRELHHGVLGAGEHPFTWDGRDARGDVAPNGLYLLVANAGSERTSRKIVHSR